MQGGRRGGDGECVMDVGERRKRERGRGRETDREGDREKRYRKERKSVVPFPTDFAEAKQKQH